jgi:hypothetical protein
MGIMSDLDTFASRADLHAETGEGVLGNVKDGGLDEHYPGNGKQSQFVVVEIAEQPAAGGASTITFRLKSSDVDDITDDGDGTDVRTHFTTAPYSLSDLAAGTRIVLSVPAEAFARYWGVTSDNLFGEGITELTAGKATAWLTQDPPPELVVHADGLPAGT